MKAVKIYDILDTGEFQDEISMDLKDINIYALMGADHNVYLKRNSKFGFDLEVINDEDNVIYEGGELHPYAVDSLASFCRCFLHGYSSLLDGELE
jgi:hypothetical protein